jgi:2-methylisocitrate lyase-like PEP mutase family enzyme
MKASTEKFEAFRKIHQQPGLRAVPSVGDVASALIFESVGFPMLTTSSMGISLSLGRPEEETFGRDPMLVEIRKIVNSVTVPVWADMQAGYGDTPDEIARSIELAIDAGIVGLMLEDNSAGPGTPLRTATEHAERIRTARRVAERAGVDLFITGRTDPFWIRDETPRASKVADAIERSLAYVEAGADNIFISGPKLDREAIAALVPAVPVPFSTLAQKGGPSTTELEALGVRELHLGSGPTRAALATIHRVAQEWKSTRTCELMMQTAMPTDQVKVLFTR